MRILIASDVLVEQVYLGSEFLADCVSSIVSDVIHDGESILLSRHLDT